MEFPLEKSVYRPPMPWQIVVALVLIGLNGLSFAVEAVSSGIAAGREAGGFAGPVLALTALVTLLAGLCFAVGACIAARLNWARRFAVGVNFLGALVALMFLLVSATLGHFNVLALASGAVSYFMMVLLSNDRSEAYTYKGGEVD